MERLNRLQITLLLLVPFAWALSNSMIIPILPRVQEVLGISQVQAGLIITALSVPTALFLPLTGFLSDRFGRVTIMIPALIIYGSGGLLAALAGAIQSYGLLLGGRVLQGIGATGTTLLALSLAGDFSSGKERGKLLGYLEATNSLGKLASPLLGAGLASLLWYGPFFIYPIVCFPLAIGLFFLRPQEKKGQGSLSQYVKTLFHVLSKKKGPIITSFLTAFIAVFIWFGNLFFLSETMAGRLNLPPVSRGIWLSVPIFTLALTAATTGRFLTCFTTVTRIVTGLIIIASALVLALVLPDWFLLYGAIALVGTGLGFVLPALNTLIVSCVSEEERGIIAASYGSVRALGSALGPVSIGLMMRHGETVTLLGAATLALVAIGAMLIGKPGKQS